MLAHSLLTLGLAALMVSADASTYSQTVCLTAVGTKSVSPVPSPTSTKSKAFSYTLKSTTTKTSTVTPSVATKTSTVFTKVTSTTTVYQTTDVFSTTTTVYTTEVPVTYSATTFTSTTTSTSTSRDTVSQASPTGFVPLQSQIASQGYTPMRKREEAQVFPRRPEALAAAPSSSKQVVYGGSDKTYPTSVRCTKLIEVVAVSTSTVTASSIKTTTAKQSTATVTSTKTISSVKTVNGGTASSTSTSTITSTVTAPTYTVTQQRTTTSTSVVTVIGPSATAYAICDDPANFLKTINGSYVSGAYGSYGFFYDDSYANARDCCNACQSQEKYACGASFYQPYNQPDPYTGSLGRCYLTGTNPDVGCDFKSPSSNLVVTVDPGNYKQIAMNGVCGRFGWDPSDGYSTFAS